MLRCQKGGVVFFFGYSSRKFLARKLQVKATMNLEGKRKFCGKKGLYVVADVTLKVLERLNFIKVAE